jgi:hypothetical protein
LLNYRCSDFLLDQLSFGSEEADIEKLEEQYVLKPRTILLH